VQLLFGIPFTGAASPADCASTSAGFSCAFAAVCPKSHWDGGLLWIGGALLAFMIHAFCPYTLPASARNRWAGLADGAVAGWAGAIMLSAAVLMATAHHRRASGIDGFNFHGGMSISPEFAALLIGLSTYTAAFIGETIRGGMLAIDRGQTEAAAALGLSRVKILRLVVCLRLSRDCSSYHSQFLI